MPSTHLDLNTCHTNHGVAVVIDVLRAFTTAAVAFDRGAQEIILTDTVERAFDLRETIPETRIIGEIDGHPVEGFDFPNSPSVLSRFDLEGALLIQRTTAGTQGVVRSSSASEIFVTSLVCASATADALRRTHAGEISFVVTGGDEDTVCAEYIEALLDGREIDLSSLEDRVRHSSHGRNFRESKHEIFPAEDLEACLAIDRFDFAMKVERMNGLCILRRHLSDNEK